MAIIYFDDLPTVGTEDDTLDMLESIADDKAEAPEHQVAMFAFTEKLANSIAKLPTREKVLLTLYYHEELNMKEIALVLGLTESRVSQLHSQMVLRLRGLLGLDISDG